ncbi:MAG: DDE-type integrase/transposase/recombinase [Deltaproteobacteria bacterium]|nr:DDE-type integrase/transposase/recombinase [Deltaproteobacteria bacterium]
MNRTRLWGWWRTGLGVGYGLHVVGFACLVVLAALGDVPNESAGWVTCPPASYVGQQHRRRSRQRRLAVAEGPWSVGGEFGTLTGPQLALQIALLAVLSGPTPALALASLPVARWLLAMAVSLWPRWGRRFGPMALRYWLFRGHQLAIIVLVGWRVGSLLGHWAHWAHWETAWEVPSALGLFGVLAPLGLVAIPTGAQKGDGRASAEGRLLDDGTYEVVLRGEFVIRYKPHQRFDLRLFVLFLRQIHLVGGPPKRPFLRQEWLAEWFNVYQEHISRWEQYLKAADWRRLMSRHSGPLLSLDDQQQILRLWAPVFWWTAPQVVQGLAAAGVKVSVDAVETVAEETGFGWLRRALLQRFEVGAEGLQPQDGWLVDRLLRLVGELEGKLEAGERLTVEEQVELTALQAQRPGRELAPKGEAAEARLDAGAPGEKGLPPGHALERLLLGWWDDVDDGSVHCPHCHCPHCQSPRVRRKSRKGRPKRFVDAQGRELVIEVYRYYCCNKDCPWQSFTPLPPGLVPYSRWTQFHRWLTLQEYAVERGCYRWTARAVGISTATAYRWVSAFGRELLPIAALFGVVRSSGVVGVDEKWVKVPKNDKPPGKHRQWMYVYFAVDVYTYDLLHVAIFPNDDTESAQVFLLELRAKGYHPTVIVTDLRKDYGGVIAAVFPKAEHHECVFHALQNWGRQLREVYGSHYRDKLPEAAALHDALGEILDAKTKRTAYERYAKTMALRDSYVKQTPAVACVFESLQRHFPKLVNAIESDRIPLTNNAVEQVIRRFEQHYRGFCGFNTIETAETYLAVFELVYRFSPFSLDAQPRVRGKSPLQLAGYDTAKFPIAQALRGIPPTKPIIQSKPIRQSASMEVVPSV